MLSRQTSQRPGEVGSVMVLSREGDAEMLSILPIENHEPSDRALRTLTPDPCLFST